MSKKNSWILALLISFFSFSLIAKAEKSFDAEVNSNQSIEKIDASFYTINSYDMVYGKEDAPIQVIEYYSLSCPHCAYFYLSVFPDLKKKYIDSGKVRWIKRIYVRDKAAMEGALLLSCVEESRRENYLRILLDKQSNWAFGQNSMEVLGNIASLGGLSKQTFQKCMDDKKTEHNIKAITIKAVEVAKISGTPSFYVNQEKLLAYSDKDFKNKFDEILVNPKK